MIQLVGAHRMRTDTVELPLVGRVAASEPVLSEGRVERMVVVDRRMSGLVKVPTQCD